MPLQFDPVLVRRLAGELEARLAGRRGRTLRLHRGMRAAELELEEGPSLLFILHPEAGFVVEVEPGCLNALAVRAGAAGSAADPQQALSDVTAVDLGGLRVTGAWSPPDERLLVIDLEGGGVRNRLVVELLTNQWNLLLAKEARRDGGAGAADGTRSGPTPDGGRWRIRAVLWPREAGHRRLRGGQAYRPPGFPGGPRRWRDEAPSAAAWRSLLEGVEPGRRPGLLLREAAWTSPLTVPWILGEAGGGGPEPGADGLPQGADTGKRAGSLDAALERYRTLLGLARAAGGTGVPEGASAWLLPGEAGPQPYPLRLGRSDAAPASSLLEAFARAAGASPGWAPPGTFEAGSGRATGAAGPVERAGARGPAEPPAAADPDTLRLEAALRTAAERAERRAASIARELEGRPDPARLREDANLILARLSEIPRGARKVTLDGFEGEPHDIELDPARSAAENADTLYELAARWERAAERLPGVLARVRKRLEALRGGLRELARSGPSTTLWELAGGRPATPERGGAGAETRLPYRRYVSSGGLEIRVGRSARQNDELTFHHSHTEDIWLHARQVPGAHVILRWGRKDANPPRRDLLEAAVAAAVHSEARHSGTVGVDWTRRKYVRSPRKAPPGVVFPERVQTVFVEPSEALLEKLKPDR